MYIIFRVLISQSAAASVISCYIVIMIILMHCVMEKKTNVLKNCLQANVPPNEVSVEWSERKSQVHLTVGHSGIGRLPV